MKELQLIDRVVVEIKSEGEPCPTDIANQLRLIALEIEEGCSGRSRSYQNGCECLWQHETPEYGGFRMGNKSLIGMHYYGSEKKDEFPVLTLMREDLEQKGFDTSNLGDEWMEKIASKVGDILLDSDYWDHLVWAADYYKVPRKEE